MSSKTPPKRDILHDILDELKENNRLRDILNPFIDVVKSNVKPYFVMHIFLQILIIALLAFVIYLQLKQVKH